MRCSRSSDTPVNNKKSAVYGAVAASRHLWGSLAHTAPRLFGNVDTSTQISVLKLAPGMSKTPHRCES
jgi:hypothetical protein